MNITKILILVKTAISLVLETVQCTSKTETIPLEKARSYVLAQDIIAGINLPPFRQSAMDGYALRLGDSTTTFKVVGEVKAGDISKIEILEGEAVRIFTGARVPDTANAVVKQERISLDGDIITVAGEIRLESNIRPVGEQIKAHTRALSKNNLISASTIGFLAGLGVTKIQVYKKPSIAIVVTGNELVEAGMPLPEGKVYESNSIMLQNALASIAIGEVTIFKITDDYSATKNTLDNALSTYDFTIVSGGISVGDYDYVGDALTAIGVDKVFYKVNQKPGKPLYFGKKSTRYVFALPGNPASALSCFYVYVALAIARYSGKENSDVRSQKLSNIGSFIKKGTTAQFLKAYATAQSVQILDGQASSMLRSFAVSNALVCLPEGEQIISDGAMLDVLLLPV